MDRLQEFVTLMRRSPLVLKDEKSVQEGIETLLNSYGFDFKREVRLSGKDIVDFMLAGGIAVEVKLGGRPMPIYKQCERYCEHEQVKALVLMTSKTMGFPPEVKGKPCYYVSLSTGWL
jgi:predicted SpoU family rRNA methylase